MSADSHVSPAYIKANAKSAAACCSERPGTQLASSCKSASVSADAAAIFEFEFEFGPVASVLSVSTQNKIK